MGSEQIRDFYENFPYPSKKIKSTKSLYNNAAWLTALVDKKPNDFKKNERILDAGCGTAEFTCGFALGKAKVLGIDISERSLAKAKALAKRFNLKNVSFKRMDVLDNNLPREYFDYIFAIGVLHHTENPKQAFSKLVRLLKPGGFIVVGLYNRYSRMPVMLKRFLLFLLAGNDLEKRVALANKLFYNSKPLTEQRKIWLADKYANPLEKTISFNEVLQWFRENNIEFYKSKPPVESLSRIGLFISQFSWMLQGISFFSISGRKVGKLASIT